MYAVADDIEVAAKEARVHIDTQGTRLLDPRSAHALASRLLDAAVQAGGACPLVPLLDRVIVHVIEEANRVSAGGVHIPDNAQPPALRGTILAVGPGRYENGTHVPMPSMNVGDIATMSRHAGYEIKVGDRSFLSVKSADILALIEKE